jgi:hypothetical protein
MMVIEASDVGARAEVQQGLSTGGVCMGLWHSMMCIVDV